MIDSLYCDHCGRSFLFGRLSPLLVGNFLAEGEDGLGKDQRHQPKIPSIPILHYLLEEVRKATVEKVKQTLSVRKNAKKRSKSTGIK
jgi:hypothetical protein